MATSNELEPQFKLIPFREGDWNDWHHESQQLMIVAHVITPSPKTGIDNRIL
jgi:hypothetical protein